VWQDSFRKILLAVRKNIADKTSDYIYFFEARPFTRYGALPGLAGSISGSSHSLIHVRISYVRACTESTSSVYFLLVACAYKKQLPVIIY